MIWCFNERKDVPRDIRDFLENASGEPLEKLSIKDINSFLTDYDAFCNQEMAYPEECVVTGEQSKIF